MQKPVLNPTPFGANGQKNEIPDVASGGSASFSQGFPALTMTPIAQGGIPPSGQDFNGILNHLDSHIVWQTAGMGYQFDAQFAQKIGGYPKGAVLKSQDGLTAYVSTADGNMTDPENNPQNWVVFAGSGIKQYMIPVGGLFETTKPYANGEELAKDMGYGTWQEYGRGRVTIGATTQETGNVTVDDTNKDKYTIADGSGNTLLAQMGNEGGEIAHKLTVDEMPSHDHDYHLSTYINGSGYPATASQDNSPGAMKTGTTGGDKPHNNMQPFVVVGRWVRVA